jgi:hypothetical protein
MVAAVFALLLVVGALLSLPEAPADGGARAGASSLR